MTKLTLPYRRWLAFSLAACMAAAGVAAQEPHDRAGDTVRLVVPYPAGGPADLVARQIEPTLRGVMQRGVVVLNVPGAGGGLGVQRLLAGPADGTQLLVGSPSDTIVAPLMNPVLGYRPQQLRLVGVVSQVPVVLVGGNHLPQASLAALLQARRAPGAAGLSYGSFGVGSQAHLVSEDFSNRIGLPLLHVPYAGAPALLQDLVAGRIDLAFLPLAGSVREFAADGRMRLYGLASEKPDERYPAVPTVDSAAALQGFQHGLWVGLFVPAATPEKAVESLQAALHAVLLDPAFKRLKAADGSMVAAPMSTAEAERYFAAQGAHYRKLVDALPKAAR